MASHAARDANSLLAVAATASGAAQVIVQQRSLQYDLVESKLHSDMDLTIEHTVRLWDVRVQAAEFALTALQPRTIIKADDWWDTVLPSGSNQDFVKEFRMGFARFDEVTFHVRLSQWWLCSVLR